MSGYPAQVHAHQQSNGSMPVPSSGGVAPVPDSYFVESRKGEVNELRQLLRGFATERSVQRKRDILKKVIGYMTIGIDVSRLFTEMMLAIETRDLVIKKMVYLYLCNYANTHPDLAQMCTNTLQKDCGNEDPMVRGLALRSLCSLNLPQMVEYISEPLRKALQDHHAYVRKTGVLGILKLYHLDPESFRQANFVDILYDMLRDVDPAVVSNAIAVLNEILATENPAQGGMALNRAIMLHLLNRVHEFPDFLVLQVLELVPRYIPATAEEGFQIMNLLDPVLRTSSVASVVATVQAFLSLAHQLGGGPLQQQVVERVKGPLVTCVSASSSEMQFVLLKLVLALVKLSPTPFQEDYRQFFLHYHEATHVQGLKLQILGHLANPDTAPDLVAELGALVTGGSLSAPLRRQAVDALVQIASKDTGGPGCAEAIVQRLVEWLDDPDASIAALSAQGLAVLMRASSNRSSIAELIAVRLVRALKYMQDPDGTASLVYLMGECGADISQAPYAIEKLIDSYDTLSSVQVKLAVLTTTLKLFAIRPPEVQRMLGRLLAKATDDDASSQDLHDRALQVYRLLKSGDVQVAISILEATKAKTSVSGGFAEDVDPTFATTVVDSWNTLALTYGKAAEQFVAHHVVPAKMPAEHPLEDLTAAADAVVPTAPQGMSSEAVQQQQHDDVGVGDLLGGGGGGSFGGGTPAPAPTPSWSLLRQLATPLSGEDYQGHWGSIPDADALVGTVILAGLPPSTQHVESLLLDQVGLHTMASGELPNEFKFFLYGQEATTQAWMLVQSNISKGDQEPLMILTVKIVGSVSNADQQRWVDHLTDAVQRAMGG